MSECWLPDWWKLARLVTTESCTCLAPYWESIRPGDPGGFELSPCVVQNCKSSGCSWQPGAGFQTQGSGHRFDKPLPKLHTSELYLCVWSHQQLLQKYTKHLNASLHPYNLRLFKGCSYTSTHNVIFQLRQEWSFYRWNICPIEKNGQNEGQESLTKEWEVKIVLKFSLQEPHNSSDSSQCSIPFN